MTQPYTIHTLGTPVRSVNWVRLFPTLDGDGQDCLVAVMGQQADNFTVVKIDPSTGATVQTTAQRPDSNYPTAAILSRTGMIYIGVAHSGCLFRYDPKIETLDDLGAINPPDDIFVCRIDEAPDGTLWIGCYGTAGLTSYEPGTERFTRHGRMDETDMYCYPLVAPDGTIACDIRVTKPHIVVFDPGTGEKRAVSPATPKEEGGRCNLIRAQDGHLYFDCSTGIFRLNGFETVPVAVLPEAEAAPVLSDGSTAVFSDATSQIYRNITVTNPQLELSRQLPITYEAAGSALFLVHGGPDGHVYGSSVLPLHLFRCNTQTHALEDLGACSTAAGEAYSMGNLDGKLYICSYPAARLSVYDPALPYQFGTEPGSNPRDIGRMDEISYRPRSLVTGPLGRVWTASVPDYGLWGGPLSWYDPQSGAFGSYRDIAGEASCWTLAWLERQALLAVGTTIQGGTGTQPRVRQASLFLWDYVGERKVWEGTPDRPVTAFNAFAVGADGRLFATVWGEMPPELIVFDPNTRVFTHHLALPEGRPLDLGLQFGPDGNLYGFTNCCLYRVNTTDLTITPLVEEKDAFQTPGPITGDSVYFSKVQTLKAIKLW